ncbi:MAG: DUF1552 domain-containing protein [Planctomycetia bacterium]
MHRTMNRRRVLRGLGASVSLPFLDAMLPRAGAAPSTFIPWERSTAAYPRMICCYVPNGVNIVEWVPKDSGENYTPSPTLSVLKDVRDEFTVVSGLGHPNSPGGHFGADTWLTGADLKSRPGADYTNSTSFDQVAAGALAKATRYPSLQLSEQSGTGGAGHSHTLSFDRNGTPLPAENSPRRLFERLFVPEPAGDRKAALRRYAERRSILDDVAAEAKALDKRLGIEDRRKMGEYLQSVRDTERQVARLQGWIDVPKPTVVAKGLQLESQSSNAHDRPMWLDVMLELAYLSFATDATRVITFEWSREAGGFGGGGENHHELSHHDGSAEKLAKLAQIDRFHLSRLDRFLKMMRDTREGDGRMLDRTAVLYGSGMNSGSATGDHSPKNLPLLVAGGRALGFKHGRHLAFDPEKHPPLSNVLLTLLQKMNIETDRFSDSTGTLAGLI